MMYHTEREINEKLDRVLDEIRKLQVAITTLGGGTRPFTSHDLWREMHGLEPLRKEKP